MNLSDAIGKDVFIFEEKQYTDADFLKMTGEELATFKARVILKISNVSDIVKEKRREESAAWYKRRKYILSLYNKMIPYINSLLYKSERGISEYFMETARLVLSPGDYEKILSLSETKYREGKSA